MLCRGQTGRKQGRDWGWIRPVQGRAGVEQPLLAALQELTQGSPSSVPIRGPRLTPSATDELFWELAGGKVIEALPGEFVLHGASQILVAGQGGWLGTGSDCHPALCPPRCGDTEIPAPSKHGCTPLDTA